MNNPNCDYNPDNKCSTYEVRILPYPNGNIICCRFHYNTEMVYRRDRNKELANDCKYDLPTWHSLEVYKSE